MPTAAPFDQVVISSNEDRLYLEFWPLVAWAYRAMFPGILVRLAFLTDRLESDPFIATLRQSGEVTLIRPVRGIPEANQAKMIRYFLAAQDTMTVSYIDDIDLIPMNRDWIVSKVEPRPPGRMLFVGDEVFGNTQAPASMMTGEGWLFRQLFRVKDEQPYQDWISQFVGRPESEDVASRTYHEGTPCSTDAKSLGAPLFSDETLVASLRQESSVPSLDTRRDYETLPDTLDRSDWKVDEEKLTRGGYLQAHAVRPYSERQSDLAPVITYLAQMYASSNPPALWPCEPTVDADMEFGGSGLIKEAYEHICRSIPGNSRILELGSGPCSTKYLSRYYRMTSIEHDPRYLNLFASEYIYAPLAHDCWGGWWYDCACLTRLGSYSLLIVDGPVGSEARAGFLKHLDLFDLSATILIDDVDREVESQMVDKLEAATNRHAERHDHFALV